MALLLISPGADAAGLGRLTVLSTLGQPLNAEVELLSVSKNESITARLASAETYQQANAQFNSALVGARVTLEQRRNGQLYLKATTPRPISEPFVELLIEMNSENGRVMRQYTALLDPPGYGRAAAEIPPPTVSSAPETRAPAAALSAPAPAASSAAAAPEAPRSAAPARRQRAAAPAPSPSAGAGQYGPVKRGETLGRIARSVRPEGVSLEQTLVGLYRHNPDAFIRKNMNLVKSGRILTVPEANQMAAVPHPEAVQEVRLQVADFNSFRGRLAERAAAASEGGSVTSGRIGTRVADDSAGQGPRDTVRLSRSERQGKGQAGTADRVRVLEEEAISRDKALADANARIAQLEQIIKDSQRAVELKSAAGGAAQKSADKAAAVQVPPPVAPGAASEPAGQAAPAAVAKGPPVTLEASSGIEPGKDEPSSTKAEPEAVAKARRPPPAAPAPELDVVSAIMDEPLYLAVGGAVVLLGGLGFIMARRRRASGTREADEGLVKIAPSLATATPAASASSAPPSPAPKPSVFRTPSAGAPAGSAPFGSTSPSTGSAAPAPTGRDTTTAAPAAVPAQPPKPKPGEGDDNDLDFDVGTRPATPASAAPTPPKASTAVPTAPPAPSRAPEAARRAPEPAAKPPSSPAPAARTEPAPAAPKPAVAEPAPATPATAKPAAAKPASVEQTPAPTKPSPAVSTPRAGDAPRPPASSAPASEPARKPESTRPAAKPAAEQPSRATELLRAAQSQRAAETKPPLEPLMPDFSLDATGVTATPPKADSSAAAKDSHVLDFDLEPLPAIGAPLEMDKVSTEPPASVDFKLDLPDLDMSPASDRSAAAPARDDHWYDVQQKFDLAKAYEEMGDKTGARDILQEVVREGDTEQQSQARKLLASLS